MRYGVVLLLLFISLFYLSTSSVAAAPTAIWVRTLGGINFDDGHGLAADSSGNIYVTGKTESFGAGGSDVFLLKYSPSGSLVWQRTWGGNVTDVGRSVAVDASGSIYVTGSTFSFAGGLNEDAFLLKFNSTGDLQWEKTWGASKADFGLSVAVDSTGAAYVTGSTSSFGAGGEDTFLLKFNSTGDLVWQRTWGGSKVDEAFAVAAYSSSNIYVAGSTASFGAGAKDALLLKFDSAGNLLWQRIWGGSANDTAHGLALDSSGNVYLTGFTNSWGAGSSDVFLLKFDPSGNLVWQKTWGGIDFDDGRGVAVDASGRVYVTGITTSFGAGRDDVLLLKFDASGRLTGQTTWGGIGTDDGLGIAVDSSGNAIATGFVSEGPPYSLSSPNAGLATPPFIAASSGNSTLGLPTFSLASPTGNTGTPSGSETYAGKSDVFLLKFGSSLFVATFPLPLAAITVLALMQIGLKLLRRRKR